MITTLGELSLEAVVPLLAAFRDSLTIAGDIALPELTGKLGGLNVVLGAITVAPPDLAGTIAAAQATVSQLQAAVGGPTVTLEAAAIAVKIGELEALLDTLTAALDLTIPSGSVSLYVFDGASGNVGAELQAAVNGSLPGAPGHANALIIMTTSPSDWSAVQGIFKTS